MPVIAHYVSADLRVALVTWSDEETFIFRLLHEAIRCKRIKTSTADTQNHTVYLQQTAAAKRRDHVSGSSSAGHLYRCDHCAVWADLLGPSAPSVFGLKEKWSCCLKKARSSVWISSNTL